MRSNPLFYMGPHQETSDDYYTPKYIFDLMGIEFDVDVAAPEGGVPWIPARRFYTMGDDGLSQPWEGRIWMNPPYSKPGPWVHRFIDVASEGVILVPVSNSRWFDRLWESDLSIVSLNCGTRFVRGDETAHISYRTILCARGEECVEAISRIGRVR